MSGNRFPSGPMPRWMELAIRAGDAAFRALPYLLIVAFFVSVAALVARSDAGTIPMRKQDVCVFLGWQPGCTLKFERGKVGRGTMEIGVDEHVSEPDGDPTTVTRAGTLRVSVEVVNRTVLRKPVVVSQVFQRVLTDAYWGWWWIGLQAPPCMTKFQVTHAVDDAYTCLTEEQLAGNPANVDQMILYSRGDWALLDELRRLHGASGVPIPIAILSGGDNVGVSDHRADMLPTTYRVGILYGFAVPAPGWVAPASGTVPPTP